MEELTKHYSEQGNAFFKPHSSETVRRQDYYGASGLYGTFFQIKRVADDILRLNEEQMKKASNAANKMAKESILWLSLVSITVVLLALILALNTIGAILRPIRSLTESAIGISRGNLAQIVPYISRDELGQLAEAFNQMARHLRAYRESNSVNLLRAQQTSQATIDSFPDPLFVVNNEDKVEMANPAARRALGILAPKPGERFPDAGRTANSLFTWHPHEALQKPLEEARRNQAPYLPEGLEQAILFRIDGHDHFFLPRILPIRAVEGETLGAAVQLQDITKFRLLDELKSGLVSTVSYELKKPLTEVQLAIHILLEETLGKLNPRQTEFLVDARDNAELLMNRVSNLLDLARLDVAGSQLDTRPEKPGELVRAAADLARPKAEDKGIKIECDVPVDLPPVAADSARLAQALGNLLDNAVTYTDAGGQIRATASLADKSVVFSIADTGIGIPPEHLAHVFDRFFRVPGQSRGTGTGLGLATAREIITAHGGTISCESRPGEGTVFHFRLPLWSVAQERKAKESTAADKRDLHGA